MQELKKGGTRTVYYSTYDTGNEFADASEAEAHDTTLRTRATRQGQGFNLEDRVPTNATYYNTASHNVIGNNIQMPHSLGHASMSERLKRRLADKDVKTLAKRQVLGKREFRRQFKQERPAKMKKVQRLRMKRDYDLLHGRLKRLLAGGATGADPLVQELMARLMQMNPYSAYGKGRRASKRRIKGKGERKTDKFEEAFDKQAKFNVMDENGYGDYRSRRKELYSDAEESSDEEGG